MVIGGLPGAGTHSSGNGSFSRETDIALRGEQANLRVKYWWECASRPTSGCSRATAPAARIV